MKNSNYWKNRMEELEKARYAKSQEYYQKLEDEFKKAENQISKDIEVWYARLAENNEISLAEAKKFLSESELEEFKWTVNEYIKHGKANTNGQWDKQLENASAKVHISRLEAIQTQIQHHCEVLYSSMAVGLTEHLADIYENTYYRTAFAIEQCFEVGTTLHALDDRRIQTAMEHCWAMDGKTFSDRIWQNKEKLTRELNTMLMQSVIQGKNAGDYIGELAKKMNVSRRNASMLIMTESAAIASKATQGCYKDLGVKEFEFEATLDDHTSEICQAMDGQHFPMSEYTIGVNAPPLHPWCRSTTVPYFDDDFTAMEKRAARDENGKTYYVPADMTYKEWKEKFVAKDGGNGTIKLGAGEKSEDGNTTRIELGTINPKDTDYLISDLSSQIRNFDTENAIVIESNGKVIHFSSSSSEAVDMFEIDLNGATILHNHPESNGIVSFGEDDFMFLRENQKIRKLHCCNAKYDYSVSVIKDISEITYNSMYVEAIKNYVPGEDIQHLVFQELSRKGYVKYERRRKT